MKILRKNTTVDISEHRNDSIFGRHTHTHTYTIGAIVVIHRHAVALYNIYTKMALSSGDVLPSPLGHDTFHYMHMHPAPRRSTIASCTNPECTTAELWFALILFGYLTEGMATDTLW